MTSLLTREDYAGFPAVKANARIQYGTQADQFGDLYLPEGDGPFSVVLLLHGGCWRQRFGLEPLGQVAETLRQQGLAVWNLEYRRLGGSGGWPTTLEDAGVGADLLTELAQTYPLELTRVVAVGHSAGGHLALWLAGRRNLQNSSLLWRENPLPLRGVLSLAGIACLERAAQWKLCQGVVEELLGGTIEDHPERYAAASPSRLGPLDLPQIHLVGTEDEIVPAKMVQEDLHELREQAPGVSIEGKVIPEVGHFEWVAPHSAVWSEVERSIFQLLG